MDSGVDAGVDSGVDSGVDFLTLQGMKNTTFLDYFKL